MDSSSFYKKNDRYCLRYSGSESYYKNGLLLESIWHFRDYLEGNLLDLGCGNKPYYDIYNEYCESSVGCDVPFSLHKNAKVEVECYAEDIDKHFEMNRFDCVLCTEVLEHTVNDRKVISNISTILKPGGTLIISTPFTYVLHEAPHDYRRYTYYGLRKILEENNFKVMSAFSMGGTFSSGLYIFYYSLTKIFFYALKSVGLKSVRDNTLINNIINFPEWLFYKINIRSFRKKLEENKLPSANEMFSSMGYFMVAEKIK
ncbi:MAG TPA: class I SAM-dependent methyltransferase [Ignavibacteria bacterium]|nr:class I SAM-dependent methyltransferase [Ignavibacteria bacterium]HMR39845.1 class I SAM-dependent methyltransferase [Ignavibacteria bacterium]